jgi:hypothetical protein
MEHYSAPKTTDGAKENASQEPTLAPIQMEIYRILERLHGCGKLGIVFGEGLDGELSMDHRSRGFSDVDYQQHRKGVSRDDFLLTYLRANPKESGYTTYEFSIPTPLQPIYRYDHGSVAEYVDEGEEGTSYVVDDFGLTVHRRIHMPAGLIGEERYGHVDPGKKPGRKR